MLQVRLLGQYEILKDGQPIILPSRPYQSLLAYLLLNQNKSHRREKLAGQFWPTSSESNARSNLRHALWRIRKAFDTEANNRLESDDLGVTYHLQPGDQFDVVSFDVCSEEENSIEMLLLAVSAYGGELLPGFYEDWIVRERERLQAAFERKIGRLLDLLLAERRWNEALEWGEHWVASGTFPEPAYRALMLAHAGLGNLSSAAAQYQRCVEVLARELGVEPSHETRAIYKQIRDGEVESLFQKTTLNALIPLAFLQEPEKPEPVFVGREGELAALDRYLEKAIQGRVQVIFVSGEAGSGKTALLQAFMRQSISSRSHLIVGWGMCNAFFGQGDPYLPFRDVLNMLAGGIEGLYTNGVISRSQAQRLIASSSIVVQALVDQGPGLLNSFLGGSTMTARIAAILQGEKTLKMRVENYGPREPVYAGELEKSQLLEQYTQVLRSIANQRPLLIFLDDLQWMDPGSGRLLFHLVRRLQNSRILIAGAFRIEDVVSSRQDDRHPLESLLNELQSSFGEILIDLDREREITGRGFIDAFLDTELNQLDSTFRQELYHRTLGNPLFTIQVLRNLQERGEILLDEQGNWIAASNLNWRSMPPQVEGIIGERIGRLNRDLQGLLMAASAEGEQFTLQVLSQVLGKEELVILSQLSRELEKRHRLVQEVGETFVGEQRLVRFRFVHASIQEYLYRQLGTAERAAIHHEIAKILEILYKEDIALVAVPLARHFRESGIKESAVKYLLQAGDQARSLYAHQEAIDHYQQALAYLKEMDASEKIARTLMKLYLVYHSSFDFFNACRVLEECKVLWRRLAQRQLKPHPPLAKFPYRLPILKVPVFDPAFCETLFDLEWLKELFYGLVEWSEDLNVIPSAASHWDVLDSGCRYIFYLRQDMRWSDGEPVTAWDFEYALKRVLDPATDSLTANLLYNILGAKDFHQGRVTDSKNVGITAIDFCTLEIKLEEPCSYFPYLMGDPVAFAVPKHVVQRYGNNWTEPGRIVTNGAFLLERWDHPTEKEIHFIRNPSYFGDYIGNIEHVTLIFHQNELDVYQSFIAGELDRVEFFIPPLQPEELNHFRAASQLHISNVPFVDAIYFVTDRPPFNNPYLRRALALATDREKLAREIGNQFPATGGYIPPGFPAHSPDIGLPYDPQEARHILAAAGYSQARDLPPMNLLLNLVRLERGDNLVFTVLHDMWEENLGITIQKCVSVSEMMGFETREDFNCFFIGWLADYPDPASFLQTNFLIDQTHWKNPNFDALISEARCTLDQSQRVKLYHLADKILIQEAVVIPLFYGHIFELRQPWVLKPSGSTIYNPQWKDITLMPH